jgi:PAS domain-containing protein
LFLYPIDSFSGLSAKAIPLGVFVAEALLINGVVAALRSARHRAEASALEAYAHQASLRQSEERFRLVVEGVKDYAIFMLDPGGHVVSWNAGAEDITGYKAEEIIGEHFSRFWARENIQNRATPSES